MSTQPTYYITTPIYYVNDVPHIGHAYSSLACDFLARFKRLDGYKVKFMTGTDEHGQKVEKSAAAANMDPLSFCDKVSERFASMAAAMNFSNDGFIRTTEQRHIKACQDLWQRLIERDEIYLGKYEGWYSVRDETFYTDDEITKDASGKRLAPTGAEVEWVEEPSYFFRLSKWQEPLLDFYEKNPDFVLPQSRMNEVKSFVSGGLRDLSVSRTSFNWGVPVPNDPQHIMYVWIDALTNYMTAVDYPDMNSEEFTAFWPVAKHMIGKDIIRHHAVYWPAFLMAAELPTPKRVFAHGWWTNEGQKISKSLGNVIDPFDLIKEYGVDAVRYFLMREVPFGNDGDFKQDAFIARMNGDLANDLGNLAQRSLSMVNKNCEGQVPLAGAYNDDDKAFLDATYSLLNDELRALIDREAIHKVLETIWAHVGAANSYFAGNEPWVLRKTDPKRMETVLYVTLEALRVIAILVQPIMPESMAKLLDQLKVAKNARRFAFATAANALHSGTILPKPEAVFPRYVKEEQG